MLISWYFSIRFRSPSDHPRIGAKYQCQPCFTRILRAILVVCGSYRASMHSYTSKLYTIVSARRRSWKNISMAIAGRRTRQPIRSIVLAILLNTAAACQSSGAVTQHDIGISIKVTCHSCRLHDSLALLAADGLHISVLPLLQLCIRPPRISTLLSANIDTCKKTTLTSRQHLQQYSQTLQNAPVPRLGCLALRRFGHCLQLKRLHDIHLNPSQMLSAREQQHHIQCRRLPRLLPSHNHHRYSLHDGMPACLPFPPSHYPTAPPNSSPRSALPTHRPSPERQLSRLARNPRPALVPSLRLNPSAALSLRHFTRKSATLIAMAALWRLRRREMRGSVSDRFVRVGGRRSLAGRGLRLLRDVRSEWGLWVMSMGLDDFSGMFHVSFASPKCLQIRIMVCLDLAADCRILSIKASLCRVYKCGEGCTVADIACLRAVVDLFACSRSMNDNSSARNTLTKLNQRWSQQSHFHYPQSSPHSQAIRRWTDESLRHVANRMVSQRCLARRTKRPASPSHRPGSEHEGPRTETLRATDTAHACLENFETWNVGLSSKRGAATR